MTNVANQDCFKNHKARYTKFTAPNGWNMEWLEWRDPNSSFYAMWFIRMGPFLFVAGDVGEATFQWHECVDLKFIAGCDLSYFAEKCQASAYGVGFKSWDESLAKSNLVSYFKDEPQNEDEEDESSQQEKAFNEWRGWDALGSQHEWSEWAMNHAEKVFGQDWWDSSITASPGLGIDVHCKLMLEGLKLAMKNKEEQCLATPATMSSI